MMLRYRSGSNWNNNVLNWCPRIALLTSFLCLLFLWILGATITVQIDSEREREADAEFQFWSHQMSNLTGNVDRYCQRKERKRLLRMDVMRAIKGKKYKDSEEEMTNLDVRENILRNSLVYIKELNQMWCLVPKAASTSWSKIIMEYLSYKRRHPWNFFFDGLPTTKKSSDKTPLQVQLKALYKNVNSSVYENAAKSETVKKILLVRHPFARLVSAYEDKLKDRQAKPDGMYFFRSYGVKINRHYREQKGVNTLKKKEPTFQEFIEYLLTTDPVYYDEHWQPISILCGMCHVRYDYIIRQEDLESTSAFHLRNLGFPQALAMSRQNPTTVLQANMNISTYFKNIPTNKLVRLFKIYQDDFQLFNYDFFGYYVSG